MEVLAPVGSWASLERAAAVGADAVYLGYTAFGARAGADNFDDAALAEAIRFAHLHHMRVHVTVNTLVKDDELPGVYALLCKLSELRADAILVQDLGVLAMARHCFPELSVHASTQMAIHNATGVSWCRRMGMTRAVLARECSLQEIRLAAREGIEVEVFVHGAQCVSVSGECYASSVRGERSGNRGRCAQPCRLPYTFDGKRGAWLSPRDICLMDALPDLMDAGVASVKIEGRLKRPEYVAVVVGSYRRAVDAAEAGQHTPANEQDRQALRQIFSRGEFMAGYALGDEDGAVINPLQVAKSGVYAGRVLRVDGRVMTLRTSVMLHPGDELRTGMPEEASSQYFTYTGAEVPAGGTAQVMLPAGWRTLSSQQLTRTVDAAQMAHADALPVPTIPMDMALRAVPGELLTLTVTAEGQTVQAVGDPVQAAQKRAMSAEDARRSLEKTGGTAFAPGNITVDTAGAFVPVSLLNELRRDALNQLAQCRVDAFAPARSAGLPLPEITLPTVDMLPVAVCRTTEQLAALADNGLRLVWYPEDFAEDALASQVDKLPEGCWLQLPTVCEEATLRMLVDFVAGHGAQLGGVVLGSVGQLGAAWTIPVAAGAGIPVMNRRSARLLLDAGCVFVTASSELTERELRTLLDGHPPIVVPSYGRQQVMLLHHCPARTALGLSSGRASCRLCPAGDERSLQGKSLRDERYEFPLLRQHLPEGCLVRMMNALPLDVMAQAKRDGFTPLLDMTDESSEDVRRVLDAWQSGRKIEAMQTTGGHWNRPVE